ncbi:MAG: S8 family serine peptidase [Parvularculaceae bacterium]
MSIIRSSKRVAVLALGVAALAIAPAYAAKPTGEKTTNGNNGGVSTKKAPGQSRYLIQYKNGDKAAIEAAIVQFGGRVVFDYAPVIDGLAADLDKNGIKSLRSSGLAKRIEDDVEIARNPLNPATDPDGGRPEPVVNGVPAGFPDTQDFDEFVPWGRDRVNADVVWSVGPNFGTADNGIASPDIATGANTGAGVVVADLDSGIDYNHPDLAANIMDDRGSGVIRDFIDGDDDSTDSAFDGHGTSTASVIASAANGVGVVGVAPGAKIRPYRICVQTCPLSAIIGGIVQATADGVDVINMSLGGPAGFNIEASAIQAAARNNIVIVASAGNDASQKVQFPAGYGQVLAVGATDINDNAASFTNYGGWVDLTGPGVNNPTATCSGCVTEGFVDETSPTAQSFAANQMTNSPVAIVSGAEIVDVGQACTTTAGDALAANPAGKVALIVRGACSFAEKVASAEAAGAIGTIIYNNAPGNFFGTLGTFASTGPSVSISDTDGQALAAEIAGGTTTADVGVRRLNDIIYWYISGTSFSAPHVAGVAALVRAQNPNLNEQQVRKVITDTAESFGNQNLFGAGMVRADNAVNAAN